MREREILCILPKMHLWTLKCSCDSFLLYNSWDQEGWSIVKCDRKTGKTAHLESGLQAAGFAWEMCCCGICAPAQPLPAVRLPLSGASCQASDAHEVFSSALSPGTSRDVEIPPSLTNKGKVGLSSLFAKPGRLQLKICACSHCSSHCTVTDRAGRDQWGAGTMSTTTICKEKISQCFGRACDWMQALDQSCLSTGLASSTEPS